MRRYVERSFCDKVCKYGFNKSAPRAQLNPTLNNGMCETETKKASTVCPESVLPEASVIVPETILEYQLRSSFTSSIAKVLLWHLRYQNSFYKSKSQPPSISASTCCLYAMRKSSKVTALYPGSFTSGDILVSVCWTDGTRYKTRFVWILAVNSSATSRAILPTHSIHTHILQMVIGHTDVVPEKVLVSTISAPASK
jgi:hypothetical protein